MTKSSGPWNGEAFYNSQWEDWSAAVATNGVLDRWNAPVVNGNRSNLTVFADSTGRQVKVNPGRAWVNGHAFKSTAAETLTIAANPGPGARADLIVVQFDSVNGTTDLAVVTGTPAATAGATATVPTPVQAIGGTWQLPLAVSTIQPNMNVLDGGGIVDRRVFLDSASVLGWRSYTPTLYSGDGPIATPVAFYENRARYRIQADTCTVSWHSVLSWSGTAGLGYQVSLPVPARYRNVVGRGIVQNQSAMVMTGAMNAGNPSLSPFVQGLVSLRVFDERNLSVPSGNTADSFDITYEVDPTAFTAP